MVHHTAHTPSTCWMRQSQRLGLLPQSAHLLIAPDPAKKAGSLGQSRPMILVMPPHTITQAQRFQQGKRWCGIQQHFALVLPLTPLPIGGGVAGDATAHPIEQSIGLDLHRANGHAEARSATGAHHPDGTAVHTARSGLALTDDRHGLVLGGSNNGATGEQRGQHIDPAETISEVRTHVRRHLPHTGQRLQMKQPRHPHRKRLGHPRQIVANQVHDHHVFCAFFCAGQQSLGPLVVVLWCVATLCGAFHRSTKHTAFRAVEEQLRRHRYQLAVTQVDVGNVATGLGAAQRLEVGQRVTGHQSTRHAGGVVDLIDIAACDGLLNGRVVGVEAAAIGRSHLRPHRVNSAVVVATD